MASPQCTCNNARRKKAHGDEENAIVLFQCWEDCAVSLLGRFCSFNAGKILQFQCWEDCAVSLLGRLCSFNAGKIVQFQCREDCVVSMLGKRECAFSTM